MGTITYHSDLNDCQNIPDISTNFKSTLGLWGEKHFRSFLWRLTTDPYTILMAEVMLHRTQVIQVVPVFQKFMSQYPDIKSLALVSKTELLEVLSPLGLRWRIDLIQDMVRKISSQFAMQVPQNKADLLLLPGVSEYIACAVRCFAWNIPEPLVDTNTIRITGRVFGLRTKDSSRRNSGFRKLIAEMVDQDNPRRYNYALLDLAHLICLKKSDPLCQECPLQTYCCFARQRS